MKSERLGLIILFVSLSAACSGLANGPSADQNSSNADAKININNQNNVKRQATPFRDQADNQKIVANPRFDFIGCWIGDKGGGLRIDRKRITHYDAAKGLTLNYSIVTTAPSDTAEPRVLLKIEGVPDLEFLKNFVLISSEGRDQVLGKDKVLIRGFESYEDFAANKFITSEYFYSADCSNELNVPKAMK